MKISFVSLALAFTGLLTLGTTGCATLDDMMAKHDSAAEAKAEPAAPVVEKTGEEAVSEVPTNPIKVLAESSGDDGSNATCCVNGAFYACPNAAAATQCLGQPFDLANCLGECTGADGCEEECARKYGPDPSSCQRDATADASCKQD
ncbi:MAG: hypothetical protein EP329_03620 [Deltaproteobacteria bacterium]|nr:MAG: hypothetical protein EP329_03620 [Deltaproteobacteria bacterium]